MRKQVIFLMTDTTRKDMVGCYGYPKMKTPNLDRLAEEGIRYENAYTCQPVCGPARSAIFTGTFPHTNGMVTNSIALGDNVKTIGQRLYDHGIQCGYIGKWHLDGSDYFGNGRCPEGWDPEYWYDMKTYLNELTDEEVYVSLAIIYWIITIIVEQGIKLIEKKIRIPENAPAIQTDEGALNQ